MPTESLPPLPQLDGCEIRHVPDWPGYAVTSTGEIWSCRNQGGAARWHGEQFRLTWEKLKLFVAKEGYPRFRFSVNGKRGDGIVHRLVLETFVGPCPPGMECCHNDGDRTNNHLANLRWDTFKGNMYDRTLHGHDRVGEKNNKAKLKERDIPQIFEQYNKGSEVKDICQDFGVDETSIYNVLNKKTWRHVSQNLHAVIRPRRGSNHHNTALDETDIIAIRRLYERGHSEYTIGPLFGIDRATVGYIARNQTWQHVHYTSLQERNSQ